MKLQYLATLSAAVAQGSLTAAAEDVNLTRSAVSLQIKQLEDYFGQALFDRSGRQLQPTAFAREVVRTVDRAMSEIEALRNHSARVPGGRVKLGITESAQTTLLPIACADLLRHAPQVDLQVQSGLTPTLLDDLKSTRIDIAIVIRPPTGGSSRLVWKALLNDELVLVMPKAMRGTHPHSILRDHPWIRFDRRTVAGRLAAQFVDKLLPHKQALIDMPSIDAIVAMVGEGVGVSVLPRLRAEHLHAHAVREVSLGEKAPIRQIAMVRRKSESDHRLLDIVERSFMLAAQRLQDI